MIKFKVLIFSIINTVVMNIFLLPTSSYYGGVVTPIKHDHYLPLIMFSVWFAVNVIFWIVYLRNNNEEKMQKIIFNVILGNILIFVLFKGPVTALFEMLKTSDTLGLNFIWLKSIWLEMGIVCTSIFTEIKTLVFIIGNMLLVKFILTYIAYVKRESR